MTLDAAAYRVVEALSVGHDNALRLIAHEPTDVSAERYATKLRHARAAHGLPDAVAVFIEVEISDSSDFEDELVVRYENRHGYDVFTVRSPSVPNALAAVTLHLAASFNVRPHLYFRWTEGNPITNLLRFLLFGEGEIAPMTREVLREAEPAVQRRPWVHVG